MKKRINPLSNFFQLQDQFNEDPQIKEKLNDLLYREEVLGENRVNRANLGIVLSIFIACIVIGYSTHFAPTTIYNFYGLSIYLVYNIVLFFLLRKGLYKSFLKYMTVTVNVSIVTFIIVGYSFTMNGWIHSLRTVTLLSYVLAIIMSGFYKRPLVAVYSCFLATMEYTAIVYYAISQNKVSLASIETFYKPVYSIDLTMTYDVLFLISGLLIAITCRQFNILLSRTLHTEAEKYNVEKAKEEIEITSRLKTNLFVNLSHETKTPLTLISNYLEKYIRQYGLNQDLRIIKQNIDKLLRDMVNFLDIEKLERGQVFYNHDQIFNLSDLLNKKIPFFQTLADRKSIQFHAEVEDSLYLQADPFAADRIINNLIDNAIKFTPKGGKVDVSLRSDSQEIFFTVSDNGIGISDDQKTSIFQPYYQITHAKRNIQGSGMGLNIVKKILDMLGGRITLESQPAKGSKFSVHLRKHSLRQNDMVQNNIETSVPIDSLPADYEIRDSQAKENCRNILVVEDNVNMLHYLMTSLGDEYNVFSATDGREALDRLRTIPKPDIIISDVMMDEMDGYEFYKIFREKADCRGVPFIFITAKSSLQDRMEGLGMGAVDYIHKPFYMEELSAKIHSILNSRMEQKEAEISEMERKISKILRSETPPEKSDTGRFESFCSAYHLTIREKEILKEVQSGMTNEQIGGKIFLSGETVKKHLQNIFRKCAVKSRTALVSLLSRYGE